MLAIGAVSALGFVACQQSAEQPSKSEEQPGKAQTTNAPAPAKAPEHPEHPK